jgi:hypothetical protein
MSQFRCLLITYGLCFRPDVLDILPDSPFSTRLVYGSDVHKYESEMYRRASQVLRSLVVLESQSASSL